MKASERVRGLIREAMSLIEMEQKDNAIPKLKLALNQAQEIDSTFLRPYILNKIAQALFKVGETKKALQVVHHAIDISKQTVFTATYTEFLFEASKTLTEISFETQNSQVLKEALDLAKELITTNIDKPHKDFAYKITALLRNIVRATKEPNILQDIITISKQIDNKYYRRKLMRSISYRLVKFCEDTTDTSFIKNVLNVVDKIEPAKYRSKAIAKITRLLTQTAEHTESLDVIQIALKLSDKMSSDYYRSKIQDKLSILKEKVKSS